MLCGSYYNEKILTKRSNKSHEYLRNNKYEYCNCCKNRTQFTCVKCGSCWSCHWLKEELERISPYLIPIEV